MITVVKAPCKSCPCRRDVPSGVWHALEYEKLPCYDGEIADQVMKRATGIFNCHSHPDKMCAGWVSTHGAHNLLALRMTSAEIDPAVWTYKSPVPLFASGAEACAHGKRAIRRPSQDAKRVIERVLRKRRRTACVSPKK